MKHQIAILLVAYLLATAHSFAQHKHESMPSDTTKNMGEMNMSGSMEHDAFMQHTMDSTMVPMTHSFSLNLPMNRNGSGTGWLPDTSPMYGYMVHSKKWMYMFHGNVFIRYDHQNINNTTRRGDSKIDAPNWLMAMGQRRVGRKGLLHFNTMFSLDALFGGSGYPLLFQTGESYKGKPLVDRQHPHDLFSELSVAYTQSFTKDVDVFVYMGYPGEPALGPVAFMHRPSALNDPNATFGHHWQDATHITFGVATIGFRYKIFKVDGSLFTGREPNENRYDFDKPRFDSYSYRLTINPCRTLSAQVSKAFIKSPEELNPSENINRTTASIEHALTLMKYNHFLTSTFVWGLNDNGTTKQNSFTLETNLQLDRFAVYGRFEHIQKSSYELQLNDVDEHHVFNISGLTLGLNYTLLRERNTNLAIGTQGTWYSADHTLDTFYGNNPKSIEVYLRISPGLMKMSNMKM